MLNDLRAKAAWYYDLDPEPLADVAFYLGRLPGPDARVLELGCGTGRVSLPLAQQCRFLHGLDLSDAMLDVCRRKIAQSGLARDRIQIERGDITDFDLGARFDLIIAPFRVIQNLETDRQLEGLFRCIRAHLAPEGRCILNVFRPRLPREELIRAWSTPTETLDWEIDRDGEHITCHAIRARFVEHPLVLYPDLVYRRWKDGALVDETVLHIPMRCFYPDEFLDLIRSAGFTITGRWGGYGGEPYGQGSELVVEFRS